MKIPVKFRGKEFLVDATDATTDRLGGEPKPEDGCPHDRVAIDTRRCITLFGVVHAEARCRDCGARLVVSRGDHGEPSWDRDGDEETTFTRRSVPQ